jgi:hypothetical protein
MTDHVFRRFTKHIEVIQILLQENAVFAEICADYEEICTWLACHCRQATQPNEECDHAWEVIRSLEDEIYAFLKNAGL